MVKSIIDKVVYVYIKGNEVKARYHDEAVILEDDKEWEHIASLEPRAYIQELLSNNEALVKKLRGNDG